MPTRLKFSLSRPKCWWCDRRYGSRKIVVYETVVEIGAPIPPSPFNLPLRKTEIWPPMPKDGSLGSDMSYFVPMDECPGLRVGAYRGRKGRKVSHFHWDGSTFSAPTAPFCSSKCGMAFAKDQVRRIINGSTEPLRSEYIKDYWHDFT